MNIAYCYDVCEVGRQHAKAYLETDESVFDAAFDFNLFVNSCHKACPYKSKHKTYEKDLEIIE